MNEDFRQDPLLLSRGIVRAPNGDYLRVPRSSLQFWQDDQPEPFSSPQAPDPIQAPDPEEGVRFGDYARSIMAGGAQVAQGVGWLTRMAGAEDVGGAIEQLGADAVDYWNEGLSDSAKDALSREFVRKNEGGEWEWGDANLNTVGLFGAQSLLGTAAGAGVGAGVTKVLQAFANPFGRAALTESISRGAAALPGAATGDVAAQAAVRTAAAAAKKLKLVDKVLGAGGFGLGEGALGGMTTGVNVYQSVLNMPADKLLQNDRYQQVFASTDENMPELERHQYAAETVAREASSLAGLQAGLTTALLGAPMGAFFGSILGKKALGAMASSTPRAMLTGAGGEAAQEFAQGGAEQMIANRQRMIAGEDIEAFDGVLNQAIGGALAGAPIGAAFGSMDVDRPAASKPAAKKDEKPKPKLEPLREAATQAFKAGVPQEEILQTVERVKSGEEPVLVAVGKLRKRQMGFAGAQPDVLQTAVQKPNAPSDVLPTAIQPAPAENFTPVKTPIKTGEELPPAPRTLADAKSGAETTVTGEKPLRAQYQLVDVNTLVTSHNIDGRANAAFPQELQPRDRSRSASRQWIEETTARFQHEPMVEGVEAGSGPPVVDSDGIVESGNGRVNLLRNVYAKNKGAGYKAYLKAHAARFGLDPADVEKMDTPVLVRARQDALSIEDRIEFTRSANRPTVASLSPAERARSDADALDDDQLARLNVPDDGNVLAAQNGPFVTAFLQSLPATERGGLLTAEGEPTKQVAERIKSALFAKAYDDDRLLALMAEDSDPDVANVVNALVKAAPAFARVGDAGFDVAGPLVEGVEALRAARKSGQAVDEFLRQQGMFANVSPEAGRVASFLSKNVRSAKRMSEALLEVAKYAEAASNPTGDLLGDPLPQTFDAALKAADQRMSERYPDKAAAQPDMFGVRQSPAPKPTLTDQIPESELFAGNPDLQPTQQGAPDFGRPPAPAEAPRSKVAGSLSQRAKARVLARMAKENEPIAGKILMQLSRAIGGRGKYSVNTKNEKSLLGKANRPSILAKRPWWNVEHVSDSFRFKLVLDDWSDLPAVVEELGRAVKDAGVTVEKADFAKFWSERALGGDPSVEASKEPVDQWGWRMLPFDLRMPNGQLAEFYITIKELNDAQESRGHDLFETWRFKDAKQTLQGPERAAFLRDLNASRDLYDGAVRQYMQRTNQSESALLASFARAEDSASVMGAKSFLRSSTVPRSGSSVVQEPPAGRAAENPSAITSTSPEPSRAIKPIGLNDLSISTKSPPSAASIANNPNKGLSAEQDAEPELEDMQETETDEEGVVRDLPLYSRGAAPGGQSASAVRKTLAAAISEVAPLINVTIAQSPMEYGETSNTQGMFVPGFGVYLFADNLPPGRELEVFTHEVFGHFALERTPFGREAVDMVLSMHDKQHASIDPLWYEVGRRWGRMDRETHAKEVIAVMAERGDKHALMTRLAAGVRRFLRKLRIVRDYSEAEIRDLIARAARALRVDVNKALANSPKLKALNPGSSDADILAAIDEAIPPDVVAIDKHLQPALFSRAAPADPSIQAIMDRVLTKAPEEFTLPDRARRTWDDIRNTQGLAVKQGLIDSFASIEALERDFTGGQLLDASQSAYKAMLATKNLPSVMAAVMQAGAPEFKNGVYTPVAGRKGIVDIFKPLTEHKDGNLLRQWELFAAANRANRLIKEKNPDGTKRENLFTQAEIDAALTLEQKYPEFRTVLNDWNTFNKQVLDLAQDSGLIDPTSRAVWEKNDYVPFYRAVDDFSSTGPRNRRGVAGQKADIQTLKGEDKALGNVFENMMMNTAHLIDASFKNRAMQRVVGLGIGAALQPVPFQAEAIEVTDDQLARALTKAGLIVGNPITGLGGIQVVQAMTPAQKAHWSTIFRRVAPKGPNIVSVMANGKPEYYEVTDPLVLSSITGMGYDNFADVWGLFRGSKRLLTNAVTADPAFMMANWVRDTLSTWVVSDASMHPFIDAIKGAKAALSKDPALMQMMMAGAGGGGFYDANPEDIRKLIASKVPTGTKGFTGTIVDTPHKAWQAWRKIGSAAENANRIAVFKAVLAKGGTVAEAAYQARDVLNFSMSGDYAAMRWLTQSVPFLNARVQGLYRLFRGARDNKKAFFFKGTMLLAATMALALRNNDREEYEELPEWDKDLYWHVFAGDQHFRIPKPFEVGAMFATVPERVWRAASGRDSAKILWQRTFQMAADTFAFNPVPQLVKPVIEQYANRSMFTGSPIVGMAESKLEPEAQFTPWTSATMRELADALPDFAPAWLRSPRRLEAALRAYTGTMGMYALGVSDAIVRESLGYPDSPGRKLHDMPVVKRFLADPNPRHTKYADLMYEMLDEANATYSTINRMRREQRFEEASELQTKNKSKLAVRVRLNRIGTQVRNVNTQIRLLQLDRTITAKEKRARIDVLVDRKNRLTRQVAPYADIF